MPLQLTPRRFARHAHEGGGDAQAMQTFRVTIRNFSPKEPGSYMSDRGPWERRAHPDGREDYGHQWFGSAIGEFEVRATDEATARRLASQMAEDFPMHVLELAAID